jgi:type I restriction enzyme S subunit
MGLGRVALTTIDTAINQDLKALIPTEKIDNQYLLWSMVAVGKEISNIGNGSTVSGIRLEDLKNIEILLPEKNEQVKIAARISIYERLLQINKKRIKTLEAVAQSLYTEWFVNFKFPGHEKVKMVDSGTEYGVIPEGWRIDQVNKVIEINPRTTLPKKKKIIHVPMECLSNDSSVIDHTKATLKDKSTGSKFKNGDTLFARITPCLQNGKIGYVNFLENENEAATGSTEFIVLRQKVLTSSYIYFLARSRKFVDSAILTMVGASGRQRVQSTFFNTFQVIVPPKKRLMLYEDIMKAIWQEIENLRRQLISLGTQRDIQIQKLIS